MSLVAIVPHDISCVYVAVNIERFLRIVRPLPPPEAVETLDLQLQKIAEEQAGYYQRLTKEERRDHDEQNKEIQEFHDREETQLLDALALAGATTPHTFDAWKVANFAGNYLESFVRREDGILTRDKLRGYIDKSVSGGIHHMKNHYWMPNPWVAEPSIVYPDFQPKTRDWLLKQIYRRLSRTKEFNLLDTVSLMQGNRGLILVRPDERENIP